MRRQGPYDAALVPSFATLVNESTADRAQLMQPLVARVTAAIHTYSGATPNVHALQAITLTKPQREALIDGYEGRTVQIKRRLAQMVDSLPAANADLCPYCSLDQNPDLDHFLPKAPFPEFSLHAANLIPICTPCNRKKLNAFKDANGARILLNPAFEPSIDATILEATISYPAQKVFVTYEINDHGLLAPGERAVVGRHFKRLGLASRYQKRAHGFLASFKAGLAGKSLAVKQQTLQKKIDVAHEGKPPNDWEVALARAIQVDFQAMLDWLGGPA